MSSLTPQCSIILRAVRAIQETSNDWNVRRAVIQNFVCDLVWELIRVKNGKTESAELTWRQ